MTLCFEDAPLAESCSPTFATTDLLTREATLMLRLPPFLLRVWLSIRLSEPSTASLMRFSPARCLLSCSSPATFLLRQGYPASNKKAESVPIGRLQTGTRLSLF